MSDKILEQRKNIKFCVKIGKSVSTSKGTAAISAQVNEFCFLQGHSGN